MADAHSLLTSLGLTKTEAAIYRAGLAQPACAATQLSRRTGIKRPTVYHALETLMQKNLARKKSSGSRVVFTMTPPSSLKSLVDRQIDQLERQKSVIDQLSPLLTKHTLVSAIDIAHYEGLAGVKAAVEEALYCRSRKWDIIAPKENFFSSFDRAYAKYFLETRTRRGVIARSLWEKGLPRHLLSDEEIRQRNPRWLPDAAQHTFRSLIILFDDKIAIISSYDALSAILIRSEEIHDTFKVIFELLWNDAKPYRSH